MPSWHYVLLYVLTAGEQICLQRESRHCILARGGTRCRGDYSAKMSAVWAHPWWRHWVLHCSYVEVEFRRENICEKDSLSKLCNAEESHDSFGNYTNNWHVFVMIIIDFNSNNTLIICGHLWTIKHAKFWNDVIISFIMYSRFISTFIY